MSVPSTLDRAVNLATTQGQGLGAVVLAKEGGLWPWAQLGL